MIEDDVVTSFHVVDESAQPLEQMEKRNEAVASSANKAEEAVKRVGKHGAGAGKSEKLTAEEQAAINEAKEERKIRRQRSLVEKVELQSEQVYHKLAETALLAVIGEENKFAQALAKGSATMEGLGTSMSGFGGSLGTVGGILTKAGGAFALAGIVVEGVSTVAEAMGVDVQQVTAELKRFGMSIVNAGRTTDALAREEEEKRERETAVINKRLHAEMRVEEGINRFLPYMSAMPMEKTGPAMMQWNREMLAVAQKLHDMEGIPVEEAMKKLEEAAGNSAATIRERSAHDEALKTALDKYGEGLQSIPQGASRASVEEEIKRREELATQIMASTGAAASERGAIMQSIAARADQYGNWVDQAEQLRKTMQTEVILQDAEKRAARAFHLQSLAAHHGTKAQEMLANQTRAAGVAVLEQARKRLTDIGVEVTPQMLAEVTRGLQSMTQHFDFRGSRFDIKQAFADMDPDRIAVAFASDLAAQGERKLQSSFAPLYSVR